MEATGTQRRKHAQPEASAPTGGRHPAMGGRPGPAATAGASARQGGPRGRRREVPTLLPSSLPPRPGGGLPKEGGGSGADTAAERGRARPAGWTPARPRSHRTRWAPGPVGKRSEPRTGAARPAAVVPGGSRIPPRRGGGPPLSRRPAPGVAPGPPQPPSPLLSGAAAAGACSKEAGSWEGFLSGQQRVEDGPIRSLPAVGGGVGGEREGLLRVRDSGNGRR